MLGIGAKYKIIDDPSFAWPLFNERVQSFTANYRYLASRGLAPREFNSYGSRRGNDDVMSRGTFANIRLVNKFVAKPGPRTVHIPSGEELDIFDAASRYAQSGDQLIILAGKEYGSGKFSPKCQGRIIIEPDGRNPCPNRATGLASSSSRNYQYLFRCLTFTRNSYFVVFFFLCENSCP